MSREDFEGFAALAKQNHDMRVAKTPDRIKYAISQFESHGIKYELKNEGIGHFHCWDGGGSLIQFWAGTGKIMGQENKRGIVALIKLIIGGNQNGKHKNKSL